MIMATWCIATLLICSIVIKTGDRGGGGGGGLAHFERAVSTGVVLMAMPIKNGGHLHTHTIILDHTHAHIPGQFQQAHLNGQFQQAQFHLRLNIIIGHAH